MKPPISQEEKVMSEIVVHGIPGSPFLRTVLATLEEKHQPYRLHAMKPGESKGPEYLKRHPFGRVPAFEHGDFQLYETQAIVRYIDAVFPAPALQPTDPQAAARMNQVIGINDWYLFPEIARVIVFQRIVGPALLGLTPDEAVIAAAAPKVPTCIGALDRLLGGRQFLAGDRLSLADLMLAPQLDYLAATPEGAAALQDTALAAWLARMIARPSLQATLPPEPLRRAA
jgi:glutathione S-transferase